ncbi:MAG TPA: pyridoxal 5'-phosphate synthase [Solirubrobacterales bacterium]|nr:pyridoxal 5'-phosphate synthase [Solirubrobacterales bacterium]
MAEPEAAMTEPLELLGRWLEEAEVAGVPAPRAMTLATATADGRPSARLVSLKRLSGDALVFTTGLWTRKAEELRANPDVAATFYWPALGRQARVEGRAEIAGRELAQELFAGRPRSHQLQTHASRQGEEIEGTEALRERLAALEAELRDLPVPCPEDWGAIRIVPEQIEFWEEAADRLHRRTLYEAKAGDWHRSSLAP